LIDMMVIMALTVAISLATSLLGFISADIAQAAGMLIFFSISIGYSMVLEWYWRGQTLGKRALRLRVMDAQGRRLHPAQIVIRNLLRFVDMLPSLFYLVGGVACLGSRLGQRLGDFAANTVVVRHPKIVEPDLDKLLEGKYNSLRGHPHLEARLRQRVSPVEASLALQALLRRDEMEPIARVELFSEMADYFRAKVPFPPEATEGIAGEQFVRNVVDIVFRPRAEWGAGIPVKNSATPDQPVMTHEPR
jgi:uncharacterized RDD family membrane protein YckC